MNRLRHLFRNSQLNRDRREDAYARAIIAGAERLRRLQTRISELSAEERGIGRLLDSLERCDWCGMQPCSDVHHPYCSASCAAQAEQESQD